MSHVYQGGTYQQSNPTVDVDSNGKIKVKWQGKDATDSTVFNIRESSSTNNGVSFSTPTKITSGNSVNRQSPTNAIDKNNVEYVAYDDNGTIRWTKENGVGGWTSTTDMGTGTFPSMCANFPFFTSPLTIYKTASNVSFYGGLTTFGESPTTEVDVRMNINPINNSSIMSTYAYHNNLLTISGKASIVGTSDNESYIDLSHNESTVGQNEETTSLGQVDTANKKVTLKLHLTRSNNTDVAIIKKIVGAVN